MALNKPSKLKFHPQAQYLTHVVPFRFYGAQIASVFEHLHSKDVVYRDLKPENIMIADDGYLKLIDYGFAKVVKKRTYTICGTPEYIAPEILLNKGHGKPVDWWTFGILIYEMHAGHAPFVDDDPMMIYKKIINTKPRYPDGFDKDLKSLVKHLLRRDLSKRFGNLVDGVNDIKDHRFFASMDWTALLAKRIDAPYVPTIAKPSQ
jgi:protein kinase A